MGGVRGGGAGVGGGWQWGETVHFSVSLMNRLNKPECGIFAPCMISFLPKDLIFSEFV